MKENGEKRLREKIAWQMLTGFFVAYLIVGILYGFGVGDDKTIMVSSIVSLIIAVSQIVIALISSVNAARSKTVMTSLCIFQTWLQGSDMVSSKEKKNKLMKFNEDNKSINAEYDKKIRHLEMINCCIIIFGVVVFVILISFRQIPGNAKIADTISLISFALLFGSKAFEMANNKYTSTYEKSIDKIVMCMEEMDE